MLLETLRPIRLPERREEAPVGENLVVSGWGVTENSETLVSDLVYTTVTTISNEECAAIYGNAVVTDAVLCAIGNDDQGPCNVSVFNIVFVSDLIACAAG